MQYKVGLYGGCFDPLHLGHVDCLMQAASLCEELYVVLSVSRVVPQIDARVRYRWLYSTTKHFPSVRIIQLFDDCASKEEYTPEKADEDCRYIKELIGKPIDCVFCGSDYGKDSFWGKCYPESTFVTFERNEISSSEIRKDPYSHWDWIPSVVRPYFVKKVLLIGGESTGKSTLTVSLANRFNTCYIDEAGREISMRSGDDRLMLSEDYTEILLRQKMNEAEALKTANKVLFIDTDALVTRFYLSFLDGDEYSENIALAEAVDALNSYDLILFLEPDVQFVQDGSRSEEICRDREKYSERLKDLIKASGKEFVSVSGDYNKRYNEAVRLVSALLS